MKITRKVFLKLSGASCVAAAARALAAAPPGTRWGMAIDVAKCLGQGNCTKCIDACNHAHNVPVIPDPRHEVKWIWKEPFDRAFENQQDQFTALRAAPVIALCNHCTNPACVRVCPTQATFLRPDGIVEMDWHRCIGCRYCMAACPYGSRSFNWVDPRPYIKNPNPAFPTRMRGVVEKCTFCSERLAEGRPPACCETCPVKALVFGNLNDPRSEISEVLRSRRHMRRKPELGTGPNVFYIV